MLLALKLHLENARDGVEEKLHSLLAKYAHIEAEVRSNVTAPLHFGAIEPVKLSRWPWYVFSVLL